MDAQTSPAERWEEDAATVTSPPGAELPQNLPAPLTSFIGRRRELGELSRLIAEERLVTLTGTGGCGKTRLAVEAASEVLEGFPDGAWWVELAPLAEEELVGAAIAETLGVRPLPGMSELQAVGAYLASRRALIVLDNCEHLLEACAEAVEALLKAAPNLVVLGTSRAPLGAGGETEWRVPSLSLPGDREPEEVLAGSAVADGASDAVALFTERALAARPDLALSADDAEHVAAICTELDGLPLAIELAAARVRILSVAQIAAGLSDRFRLLSGGPRTATPRLQAIRASVEWSHELLSDAERALLRRLAVFAGGATLEAVDQICAGDGIEPEAVLDLLASLVEQSLVIAEERDRGVRYRLLETVRQYGLEQLADAGEEESTRARHRDYFLALAEEAGPQLETGRQPEFLELLDPEASNLAAAIDCAIQADPRLALRFCASLYKWWAARGRYAEAELAYSRTLEAAGGDEPALTALALRGRTYVAVQAGEYEASVGYATEALALAEEVGHTATAARARIELGGALQFPNPAAGRAEMARGAELARESGDDWAFVHAKGTIAGTYLWQSDWVRGAAANDEVAELAEKVGDSFHVAKRWFNAGWLAVFTGTVPEARESIARAQQAAVVAGDNIMEGLAGVMAGLVDVREGQAERALAHLNDQLELALKLGSGGAVPFLLGMIAWAELASGNPEEAREKLEGVLQLVEGSVLFSTAWSLWMLADARRLLKDDDAEATAARAEASAVQLGNTLFSAGARVTQGRLAAGRGEWTHARQHALTALDVCVQGGHLTYLPGCVDALAEVAAGLEAHEDAVRLFAAAERARTEISVARVPPEDEHWAAIDAKLREALAPEDYETAHAEGAELGIDDAVEWARRARGPRKRPAGGWESLTPTEVKVAELVAEGLTNPQVAERMFVSPGTVKTHLSHIFRKLDVHSRSELSARAGERKTTG